MGVFSDVAFARSLLLVVACLKLPEPWVEASDGGAELGGRECEHSTEGQSHRDFHLSV